jgi:hypothetical protein
MGVALPSDFSPELSLLFCVRISHSFTQSCRFTPIQAHYHNTVTCADAYSSAR